MNRVCSMGLLLMVAVFCGLGCREALRAAPPDEKIILDTDIGDDIDDAYALALLVTGEHVKILGVTTTYGQTRERAELAAKLLQVMGRPEIPVYAGRRGDPAIHRQYDWARGFKSRSLHTEGAVEFIRQQVERYPGQVTLVGIGPFVNLGDFLTRYPALHSKIKRIVIMGGAVYVGYNNQAPPTPEWNVRAVPEASKALYSSGVPIVMAGLEVTTMMKLDPERQKKLFAHGTRTTDALAALTNLWGGGVPTLFDPVAVAYALGHSFSDSEQQHIEVNNDGLTQITPGPPNVTVLVHPRPDEFLDWYVSRVGQGR